MNDQDHITYIAWRFYLILAVICLAVAGLIWRVFDLAILEQHFLRHQGDERVLRAVSTPAFRGMIVDRNGYPLAVSTTVYSVWMNPKEFAPDKKLIKSLAGLIGMEPRDILAIVNRNQKKKREFVYLKRSLSPEIANKVKALAAPGLYTQQEYRRYYPEGEIAAHVIGFTNVDDQGQEGLELGYNQWLQGEPGKKWVIKDRLGRVISDVQTEKDQKAGHDLVLSIDRRVQYLAYRELMAGVEENKAASGSAIVLDAKSGEVLAMVNLPSFNPNNRAGARRDSFRNRAVTDTFEPGSTIKPFSVAVGLKSGKFKPGTVIDTSPGWFRVGHNIVMDHKNNGPITVTEVLQMSSNVGVSKIVLSLQPNLLWELLHRVGFGETTEIGFPGEQHGALTKHDPWGAFTLATMSYGYGLSVTELQLAQAYMILANDGIKFPVSLLHQDNPPKGVRVMDAKLTHQVLNMMEAVMTSKDGTGKMARVPGYRVAGKTGTAKMAGDHGYQKHRYTSSFVGIAPLTNPQFIVAVVIHDPQGKNYYGGEVSGPVFSRVMESTLRLYDVAPDAAPETSDTADNK